MSLLGPADVRALAGELGIRPTKTLGQNFLHDPNTIRRLVRTAALEPGEPVLEVGPGLGSLTLGLLAAGHPVTAVEIDPVLAGALPATVAGRLPGPPPLTVVTADALRLAEVPGEPTALVANLPYNVAVPVVLHLLGRLPGLRRGLVMVQAEVADRLAAAPGSRTYGVPSVKTAWYARATRAGAVPRAVFWPVPNVESGLVRLERPTRPATTSPGSWCSRWWTPPSPSAARPCAPRWRAGPAPQPPLKPRCGRRGSTRAPAARPWTWGPTRDSPRPGGASRCRDHRRSCSLASRQTRPRPRSTPNDQFAAALRRATVRATPGPAAVRPAGVPAAGGAQPPYGPPPYGPPPYGPPPYGAPPYGAAP